MNQHAGRHEPALLMPPHHSRLPEPSPPLGKLPSPLNVGLSKTAVKLRKLLGALSSHHLVHPAVPFTIGHNLVHNPKSQLLEDLRRELVRVYLTQGAGTFTLKYFFNIGLQGSLTVLGMQRWEKRENEKERKNRKGKTAPPPPLSHLCHYPLPPPAMIE